MEYITFGPTLHSLQCFSHEPNVMISEKARAEVITNVLDLIYVHAGTSLIGPFIMQHHPCLVHLHRRSDIHHSSGRTRDSPRKVTRHWAEMKRRRRRVALVIIIQHSGSAKAHDPQHFRSMANKDSTLQSKQSACHLPKVQIKDLCAVS